MDRSVARRRYGEHKASATSRGIEFDLTFEEWWSIWEPRFSERGRGKEQLGMCRTRDQGPYRVGNVRLDTPKGNAAERGLMQRCAKTYWHRSLDQGGAVADEGFKSYGSSFPRPDHALEIQRGETDFEPYL